MRGWHLISTPDPSTGFGEDVELRRREGGNPTVTIVSIKGRQVGEDRATGTRGALTTDDGETPLISTIACDDRGKVGASAGQHELKVVGLSAELERACSSHVELPLDEGDLELVLLVERHKSFGAVVRDRK